MYTYFVSYSWWVPTGAFFTPWVNRLFDIIVEVPERITSRASLIDLKNRIAAAVSVDSDPCMGRGQAMDHWCGKLFFTQENIASRVTVHSFQLLSGSPN
jgi:hypothetical protein